MVLSQIFCLVLAVLGCVLALSSKPEHEKPGRSSLILTGLLSLLNIGLAFSPIAISPGFDPGRFLALGIGLLSGIAMSFLGAKSGPIFAIGIAGLLSAIPCKELSLVQSPYSPRLVPGLVLRSSS